MSKAKLDLKFSQTVFQIAGHRGHYQVMIFGMKAAFKLGKIVGYLVIFIADHSLPTRGEVNLVGGNIPVPQALIGSFHGNGKTGLAIPQ